MFNKNEDDIDFEDAIEQLLEIQRQIDETAQKMVGFAKRIIDARETLEPGCNAKFAKTHHKWYDATSASLESLGFKNLGEYESVESRNAPDDKRSFYRFALSADGTIVASFFVVASAEPLRCLVLQTSSTQGSSWITASGGMDSGMPLPPNRHARSLSGDTPVETLVARHREIVAQGGEQARTFSGMHDILPFRTKDAEDLAAYRRSLGLDLFEPYLRTSYGDRFDDEGAPVLESILNHPEWWTGEKAATDGKPLAIMFLMSTDDEGERKHVTTAGLLAHGLPELQMKALAANHCRAARFLMSAVAHKLVAHAAKLPSSTQSMEERLSGTELTLTRDEVFQGKRSAMFGTVPDAADGDSAVARLELEEFDDEAGKKKNFLAALFSPKRSAKLLSVKPPHGTSVNADAWVRESCRRLGMDAPVAAPASAYDETMAAASRQAVADLDALRVRLQSGIAEGGFVAIKTGLPTKRGGREYVWVKATEWPSGEFVGELVVDPVNCPGYVKGQTMRIADADVFDRAIGNADGETIELALTDLVAMDFGVDLPRS